MFIVRFQYTRRQGQRKDRYPDETETVTVTEEEIEAMRGATGVPETATREDLAEFAAYRKRESRPFGRKVEVTVNERPMLAKVA